MKKNRIVNNYIYNLLYQMLLIIVPIVLTPYLARVLGEEEIGKYSFAHSIVNYFLLIAMLGFSNYSQRLIASHQGDSRKQTIDFYEILIAKFITCLLSFVVYELCILMNIYKAKYILLMKIMGIEIIAAGLDISFFFQGNEEFGKIVVKNFIIKLLSIFSIFYFVKLNTDLYKYVLILSLSALISNMSLWPYMHNKLTKININELNPKKHLIPVLILFLPTIATTIYTNLDKTLIGIITNSDIENGNYEYAERIVKLLLTIITSLGTVLVPNNSKKYASGDIKGLENNLNNSLKFVLALGTPLTFGIIAISNNLLPWFLGNGFNIAKILIKVLSPLILIIGMSNVFGMQYLIPSGKDKEFTLCVTIGAITNFLLNLFLISYYKSLGAAISTILAETFVTIIMYIYVIKDINIIIFNKQNIKYFISSIPMFIVCYHLSDYLLPSIINTIIIAFIGIVIYCLMLIILKDDFIKWIIKKQ